MDLKVDGGRGTYHRITVKGGGRNGRKALSASDSDDAVSVAESDLTNVDGVAVRRLLRVRSRNLGTFILPDDLEDLFVAEYVV